MTLGFTLISSPTSGTDSKPAIVKNIFGINLVWNLYLNAMPLNFFIIILITDGINFRQHNLEAAFKNI